MFFGSSEPFRVASQRTFVELLVNALKVATYTTYKVFDYTDYPEQTKIEIHLPLACRKLKIMNLNTAESNPAVFSVTVDDVIRKVGLFASAPNKRDVWEYYAKEEGFKDITIDGGEYPPYFYAEVFL